MSDVIKQKIKKISLELGFDDLGFASATGELPYSTNFEKALEENRYGPLDYLKQTHQIRSDILKFFPDCKTVLIVVKNYYTADHPQNISDEKMPKIARYAWGKDYHQWFKKNLKKLALSLDNIVGVQTNFRIFNDTAPVLERAWAQKSGLGFIGKSSLFIHRKMGTWTLLGGIAWDYPLPNDPAYSGPDCGKCTKCIDACPTNAIVEPRKVDASKCISTWTIERPTHPDSIKFAFRDHEWAFGCDICQEICPWNKFKQISTEERFKPSPERIFLTRATFEADLRGTPLNRARKSGLLVNFLRIRKSLNQANLKLIMKD